MIKQAKLDFDDSWIDELFQWADSNNIPELQYLEDLHEDDNGTLADHGFWIGLPRNKETLLNLEELDLSWHACTEIPDQIRHLTNLKALRFAKHRGGLQPPFYKQADKHHSIDEIPDWISDLENLEELDLSGNNIISVHKSIGKLKKLKALYLHENRIEHISNDLAKLDNLEILWIQWNRLPYPEDCLMKLQSLRELWFDGVADSDYGPIERCPEGLKWPTENGYAIRHISRDGQNFNQHQKKNLAETIDLMGLWK